ncbi:MAG: hypothetical protein MZV65_51635 [Chromatiales bacterium]|nr:hypothetical protein [Chromatiales bacterium]
MTDENKIRLYREGRFEDLAQRLLTEAGRDGFNKALLKPSFKARIPVDAAIARLALEIKVYADATNPMQAFIFWNRTRRCISQIPFAIMSHIPVVHCPYLDHALYDFLTGVDQSYLLNNRLHDAAIHRAYPKYADRPFENRSSPILKQRGEMLYYQKNQGKFFAFLLKRAFDSSLMLRKSPLYLRTLLDIIRWGRSLPWYLAPAMHCIALTEACQSAVRSTKK